MTRKINGKHIANYTWHSTDNTAIVDRCLEVYELKTCMKLLLWNSGIKGWKGKPNKPIVSLTFNKNGNNMDSIMEMLNIPKNATIARIRPITME